MRLSSSSSSNEPLAGLDSINPQFFGAITETTQTDTQSFWVSPQPISRSVTVTPAPVVQNGVVVDFPPYTEEVWIQPPAKEVVIHIGGTSLLKNSFESVGVIQGGHLRLCALVRPNVIAAARHYNVAPFASYIGMTVKFVGSAGTETAKITRVAFTKDDFECYYLDKDISAVSPAVIAPLETPSFYSGREVVLFGLASLAKPIAGKTKTNYAFGQQSGAWTATGSNRVGSPVIIEKGDSGAPAFLIANGSPRYLGSMAAMNLSAWTVNLASPHAAAISAL